MNITGHDIRLRLGCAAKDTVTGFTGIVINVTEWFNGCIRWGIQPRMLREGKPIDAQFFDDAQVEYLGVGMLKSRKLKDTGGDRTAPIRAADPTR